jgi:hypothetical protein
LLGLLIQGRGSGPFAGDFTIAGGAAYGGVRLAFSPHR